jgi:hypothetical protein
MFVVIITAAVVLWSLKADLEKHRLLFFSSWLSKCWEVSFLLKIGYSQILNLNALKNPLRKKLNFPRGLNFYHPWDCPNCNKASSICLPLA